MRVQRGLARAAGAHEAVDLARGGLEGDAVEGFLVRERPREIVDVDYFVSHFFSPFASFFNSAGSPAPVITASRSRTSLRMSSAVKLNWCASANRASMRCSITRRRFRSASCGRASDTNVPDPCRL